MECTLLQVWGEKGRVVLGVRLVGTVPLLASRLAAVMLKD